MMVGSSLCFALMHTLIRQVSADVDPFQIAFLRNFFGLVIFIPFIVRSGLVVFRTSNFPLHCGRALLNVCAMMAFFTALSTIDVAKATALNFTAPIYTAILSVLFLGERFRLRRWGAIGLGFVGMLVILRPGIIEVDRGSILVLSSAILWGIVMMLIKFLGRTESSLTITAYMNVLMSVLSLVPALFVWTNPPLEIWGILLAIGLTGTAAQLGLAESLKRAEATFVLPFEFLRLIWAALLGFLMFSEVPDVYTWLGGGVIFASTLYLAYRERLKSAET